MRNTGICISGPACIVRKRIAIPPAQKKPQKFTRAASTYRPARSTAPPPTFMPTRSAITVSSTATIDQRTSAANAYPRTIPLLRGAASRRRFAKPPSKSRATPNPVNTPLNAADCSSTNTNWNAV
jgi:hypothetical protein